MGARGGDTDEGQCKTCGGSGKKQLVYADEKGETWRKTIDCPDCGGTGKR